MKFVFGISLLSFLLTAVSVLADDQVRIEIGDLSADQCQEAAARITGRLEAVEQHLAGFHRTMIDSIVASEHPEREQSNCSIELKSQNANIGFFWKQTPKIKRVTASTDDACLAVEADVLFDVSNLFAERLHTSSGILLPPSKCWVRYLQVTTLH